VRVSAFSVCVYWGGPGTGAGHSGAAAAHAAGVCVCVCVCERERKCERVSAFSLCEWGCARHRSWSDVYVVCVVCVCA